MSATVWHTTMSLDGFIAGPDDAMEWAFGLGRPSDLADEVMGGTGAILAGRRWYDVATERYDGRAGIYGGRWEGPAFVLTHDPPERYEDGASPSSLGDGVRLYGGPGAARVDLARTTLEDRGDQISVRYSVKR